MKEKLLILSTLFFMTISFSQQVKTDFGVKGGLNYSNRIDNIDTNKNPGHIKADYNGQVGFFIGGYLNIHLNEKFLIQPELLISRQGADTKIEFSDLGSIYTDNDVIRYKETKAEIEEYNVLMPILLIYDATEKLFFELGPQTGYNVKRKISYEDAPLASEYILKNDDSENFEFGLIVGFGYKLDDKSRIGIRYNYGLTERQNLHSSEFQLGFQYKL